ncbi:putative Ubiquitin carboxyl-terminal hydrolase 34 [Blattamonas nauphoetae]|uniref:Ubiquitin carboxyl-terminal hydrolase 34 n=1 Tax=Blattamonas nauphoetae TaxID=2049346 RepID=A0ABQ9YJ77_9EUKA|nr:putative Ubiquitin carboxyl-terminal hydrolase 34 [Blattamonas nauphoetae]
MEPTQHAVGNPPPKELTLQDMETPIRSLLFEATTSPFSVSSQYTDSQILSILNEILIPSLNFLSETDVKAQDIIEGKHVDFVVFEQTMDTDTTMSFLPSDDEDDPYAETSCFDISQCFFSLPSVDFEAFISSPQVTEFNTGIMSQPFTENLSLSNNQTDIDFVNSEKDINPTLAVRQCVLSSIVFLPTIRHYSPIYSDLLSQIVSTPYYVPPALTNLFPLESSLHSYLYRSAAYLLLTLRNRTCSDATTHQDAIFSNVFSVLKHFIPALTSQGTSTEKMVQTLDVASGSDLSKLLYTKPLEMLSFILSALFTLDPGTQQPIIAHAVSRGEAFKVLAAVNSLGHIVGRSITKILSRLFNKPAVRFALKSVKNVVIQRSFDVVGLQNLGATCYMNSVLQILNAHLPLRLSLFANSPTVPAKITYQQSITGRMQNDSDIDSVKTFLALQKLFVEMQETSSSFINTQPFVLSLSVNGHPINVGEQFDCEEFLSRIFDRLERALVVAKLPNVVKRFFYGSYKYRTVRQCGHHTHSIQPFHIIQLEVNHGNLLDAFRAAQKPSEMGDRETFQCGQCGQSCEQLRQEQFGTLPNTLLVQLKRFTFTQTAGGSKNEESFEFPFDDLDMTPFVTSAETEGEQDGETLFDRLQKMKDESQPPPAVEPDPHNLFRLVGVVVHSGTLQIGHYCSFIRSTARGLKNDKSGDGTWYFINDRNVTKVDEPYVKHMTYSVNNVDRFAAYLLVYERVNPIDEWENTPSFILDEERNRKTERQNMEERVKREEQPPSADPMQQSAKPAHVDDTELSSGQTAINEEVDMDETHFPHHSLIRRVDPHSLHDRLPHGRAHSGRHIPELSEDVASLYIADDFISFLRDSWMQNLASTQFDSGNMLWPWYVLNTLVHTSHPRLADFCHELQTTVFERPQIAQNLLSMILNDNLLFHDRAGDAHRNCLVNQVLDEGDNEAKTLFLRIVLAAMTSLLNHVLDQRHRNPDAFTVNPNEVQDIGQQVDIRKIALNRAEKARVIQEKKQQVEQEYSTRLRMYQKEVQIENASILILATMFDHYPQHGLTLLKTSVMNQKLFCLENSISFRALESYFCKVNPDYQRTTKPLVAPVRADEAKDEQEEEEEEDTGRLQRNLDHLNALTILSSTVLSFLMFLPANQKNIAKFIPLIHLLKDFALLSPDAAAILSSHGLSIRISDFLSGKRSPYRYTQSQAEITLISDDDCQIPPKDEEHAKAALGALLCATVMSLSHLEDEGWRTHISMNGIVSSSLCGVSPVSSTIMLCGQSYSTKTWLAETTQPDLVKFQTELQTDSALAFTNPLSLLPFDDLLPNLSSGAIRYITAAVLTLSKNDPSLTTLYWQFVLLWIKESKGIVDYPFALSCELYFDCMAQFEKIWFATKPEEQDKKIFQLALFQKDMLDVAETTAASRFTIPPLFIVGSFLRDSVLSRLDFLKEHAVDLMKAAVQQNSFLHAESVSFLIRSVTGPSPPRQHDQMDPSGMIQFLPIPFASTDNYQTNLSFEPHLFPSRSDAANSYLLADPALSYLSAPFFVIYSTFPSVQAALTSEHPFGVTSQLNRHETAQPLVFSQYASACENTSLFGTTHSCLPQTREGDYAECYSSPHVFLPDQSFSPLVATLIRRSGEMLNPYSEAAGRGEFFTGDPYWHLANKVVSSFPFYHSKLTEYYTALKEMVYNLVLDKPEHFTLGMASFFNLLRYSISHEENEEMADFFPTLKALLPSFLDMIAASTSRTSVGDHATRNALMALVLSLVDRDTDTVDEILQHQFDQENFSLTSFFIPNNVAISTDAFPLTLHDAYVRDLLSLFVVILQVHPETLPSFASDPLFLRHIQFAHQDMSNFAMLELFDVFFATAAQIDPTYVHVICNALKTVISAAHRQHFNALDAMIGLFDPHPPVLVPLASKVSNNVIDLTNFQLNRYTQQIPLKPHEIATFNAHLVVTPDPDYQLRMQEPRMRALLTLLSPLYKLCEILVFSGLLLLLQPDVFSASWDKTIRQVLLLPRFAHLLLFLERDAFRLLPDDALQTVMNFRAYQVSYLNVLSGAMYSLPTRITATRALEHMMINTPMFIQAIMPDISVSFQVLTMLRQHNLMPTQVHLGYFARPTLIISEPPKSLSVREENAAKSSKFKPSKDYSGEFVTPVECVCESPSSRQHCPLHGIRRQLQYPSQIELSSDRTVILEFSRAHVELLTTIVHLSLETDAGSVYQSVPLAENDCVNIALFVIGWMSHSPSFMLEGIIAPLSNVYNHTFPFTYRINQFGKRYLPRLIPMVMKPLITQVLPKFTRYLLPAFFLTPTSFPPNTLPFMVTIIEKIIPTQLHQAKAFIQFMTNSYLNMRDTVQQLKTQLDQNVLTISVNTSLLNSLACYEDDISELHQRLLLCSPSGYGTNFAPVDLVRDIVTIVEAKLTFVGEVLENVLVQR